MNNIVLRGLLSLLGLFGLWQLAVVGLHIPAYLLPAPLQVFASAWLNKTLLLQELWPTFLEVLIGLGASIIWGMMVAIAMGLFRPVRFWLLPLIIASQAMPTFAFAPLLILWLGYGIGSKIAIIMVVLFFPITAAFYEGIKQVPTVWLDLAFLAGASRWRTMRYISLPAALPALASGLKVAAVWAPMAAVIGEWVGASQGLGFLLLNAQTRLDMPLMFATLLVLVGFSLLLFYIIEHSLKRMIPWQKQD